MGPVHGRKRVHGAYTCVRVHVRVHGRVHGPSCTWQVGLHGRGHGTRRPVTTVCGSLRRVHGRYRARTWSFSYTRLSTRPRTRPAVYMQVHGCVHGPDGHCTWPCIRPAVYTVGRVHGRVRAMYTAENGHVHGPYTVVYTGRIHGPCARSVRGRVYRSIRPVHGRVHDSRHVTWPCTDVYTAVFHRASSPSMACTRPVYTYAHIHGRMRAVYTVHGFVHVHSTRPCTRPVHGPVSAVYTSRVQGRVRAMYTTEDGRAHGPYTVVNTAGVRRPTRPRPVHVPARTRPCTCRLRGQKREHGPCTRSCNVSCKRPCILPCTRHVTQPCTRPVCTFSAV